MMNKLLTVLAFAILIRKSVTLDVGTCTLEDDGTINWLTGRFYNPAAVNDVDGLNLKMSFSGNLEVETSNDQDSGAPYLEVTIEGSELVFRTNDYFISNFEEDQLSQDSQQIIELIRTVTLKCEGAQTIFLFIQQIFDKNNNKPIFKSPSYTYTLPSQLVPKLDLSSAGEAIIVEDKDFSNSNVTFNVEPPGTFTIETVSTDDTRTYRGILRVSKYTTLSSQTILTVTATDNGYPTSTSDPVTISINVHSEDSVPNPPTFSAIVYRFEYSTSSGTPTVTSSDDKPIVITSTDPENTIVYTDNPDFIATYESLSSTVTIEYIGTGLEITKDSVMVLTLTASLNGDEADSSKAVILIDVPTSDLDSKSIFNRAFYTATYTSSNTPQHTVTLDQEIIVSDNTTIFLQNENGVIDVNFDIEYTGYKWQLKLKENLSDKDLKANEKILILFAWTAKDSVTYYDYATLVVKLSEIKSPKFTSPLYTATYDIIDGNGVVTLNDDIAASSDDQTVIITLKDPSVYFDIVNSGDKWTLEVLENLPQKDLIVGTEYVLTLEATISGQNYVEPGYSILTVIPTPVIVPTFSKSYYTATYQVDNDVATVEVSNGPIEISLGSNQIDDISVTLEGDYYQHFNIEFDTTSNTYNVNVVGELDQNVLRQGNDIILTISATTEYSTVSTLLIITLPKIAALEAPKFSRAYYTASYVVEADFATLTLDSTISVTSSQDQEVTVDFAEATENFSLVKVAHNTWVVALKENVSDDDLEEHDLIFSLEATVPGSDVERSTLIIHLQSKCTNVF